MFKKYIKVIVLSGISVLLMILILPSISFATDSTDQYKENFISHNYAVDINLKTESKFNKSPISQIESINLKIINNSWLLDTMDQNQSFVNAIVQSYNREFHTNLSEDSFTQESLNKMTYLNLSDDIQGGDLPDKFFLMPNLKEVQASNIDIKEIPTSIGDLKYLEILNWNLNNIDNFPIFLTDSKTLTYLYINTGSIEKIPEEVYKMSQLKILDMRFQHLVNLPSNFFSNTWGNNMGTINILLQGNQVTSNFPNLEAYDFILKFNQQNNLIGNALKQDQLISNSIEPIIFEIGDNITTLAPDNSILGLESGRELFSNHKFIYYADDENPLITNDVVTSEGNGYIYIKSLYSEISNTYAKVKVPIKVNSVTGSDINILYQDTEGNPIAPTLVKSGNIGELYSSEQLPIEGYTFKEVFGNPNGTFTDTAQTVTYVYTKNSIAGSDVTVYYQDTEGNPIAPTLVKSGNIGEPYSSEELPIEGYTFKEVFGNRNGAFTDTAQTVIYVYTKNVLPVKSVHPNLPTVKNLEQTTSTNKLPQTGEIHSLLLTVVGSMILLISGVYVLNLKK